MSCKTFDLVGTIHGREYTEWGEYVSAVDYRELKSENESLRQQLEARHPFKPAMDEVTIGYTGCLICGKYTDHGGLQCPKMRAHAISSPENP